MRDHMLGIERGAAFLDERLKRKPIVLPAIPNTVKPQAERANTWPVDLDDAAYCGLVGDIVKQIEPQTESDPAAILLQILVCFGALVGRGPHVRVEGDQHHANLFALIVGDTAKARKGTSLGRVKEIFRTVPNWPNEARGLSSGEGLIWSVRDPIFKIEHHKVDLTTQVEVDAGISDKRLLVEEAEFSQVLRQAARSGNVLSPTIRSAWDTGTLSTLTKNNPAKATGAHICIIGHITADELRADLTATDSANGFANRFLFMCAKRSKKLPFGGNPIPAEVLSNIQARIMQAVDHARNLTAVEMTPTARVIWKDVYATLSEGYSGLFGAVTARAEAQSLRLALLYALMDKSSAIEERHLLAALAVWERSADSARHIFGTALGDPVADDILRAIKVAGKGGMTRTAISKHVFSGHKPAERIGAALELLRSRSLIICETRPTEGAPAEIWVCQ